ncbi:MAG: hypothetical protein ABI882_18830 [Acidobacteriota bacterium]
MKHILAVPLVLVMGAGAVCAQVCDISCVVQGGRGVASHEDQRHNSPSGHCHQQSSESPSQHLPSPQPRKDHSSDCQSHAYAVELIKSGKNAVANASRGVDSPAAALTHAPVVSLNHLGKGQRSAIPDSSPPPPQTYSILRV